MSIVHLELPAFVQREVEDIARRDGISPEQLMVIAIAEKTAALRAVESLEDPGARALCKKALEILARVPEVPPVEGDEVPPELAAKIEKLRALRRN